MPRLWARGAVDTIASSFESGVAVFDRVCWRTKDRVRRMNAVKVRGYFALFLQKA